MSNEQPAFPVVLPIAHEVHYGLSIRDYFAGQVLAGGGFQCDDPRKVAEFVYEIADALIAERGR